MEETFPSRKWAVPRPDLLRALALAVLAGLLWCLVEDRWSAASWHTPLTYLSDPEKGDVFQNLAWIKAARDGHISPFSFSNVPQLGAPYTANWDDVPLPEKPLIIATGLLARALGLFAAANAAVMIGQVLAAVAFYAAGRLLGAAWSWAFAGALVFAFSRYAFAQGLSHVTVLYFWQVPLCLVVVEWLFRGQGIRFGERRFLFALAVAAVTGVQHVYYTWLFAQFVCFGGLVQTWRRGWRALLPAAAILGAALAAFVLINLNSILYGLWHGPNPQAVSRDYHWLEVYGLKLVDLVVPPPDHPFPPFAAWGAAHLKEVLLSPGETFSAYLGLLGLAALAWLVLVSLRRAVDRRGLPLEAWLILWIILYAGVGGLNGVLGTWGLLLFRTTTRYSIFLLCIVLLFAARRLSAFEPLKKFPASLAALLAVLLALWDQTPPFVTAQDLASDAQAVASDRNFTRDMEKRLPPQAMVFQLPVMDFPESPVRGVGSYEHFRPYLYSDSLRFSFGSDKGRPQDAWQRRLPRANLADAVHQLERYGFAAICINTNGYPDQGTALLQSFQTAGYHDMIQSERGDLLCVLLQPSPNPVLPGAPSP